MRVEDEVHEISRVEDEQGGCDGAGECEDERILASRRVFHGGIIGGIVWTEFGIREPIARTRVCAPAAEDEREKEAGGQDENACVSGE